ncbi:MAG: CbiQ family ECF transporter T component [Bacillota bacterium]|nr:CbiQ family ECF transporter T component [Bacillota bacterium]
MNGLDPRTKMMMIAAISGAAMLTDQLLFLAGLFLFTVIVMVIGRISLERQKKQLAGAVGMVVFLFILQAIFGQPYLGMVLAIRLMIVILSAVILLTGQSRDYLLALVQMKLPYELSYMVILAFHFFPLLQEEARDVLYSVQLRGTELKKTSIKNRLVLYGKMCIPILTGALERAKDTSIAMEARGFRAYKERTYMRKLKLKKKDVAIIILMPVLAAGFLILSSCTQRIDGQLGQQVILSMTGESTMTVSWTADREYDGVVRYEGEEAEAQVAEIRENEYYRYRAELTDLETGETYRYCVGDGEEMSEESEFTVGGSHKEDFSFLYIGDIQYEIRDRDFAAWGEFMKEAYEENDDAELGIFAGDMVEKNSDVKDWAAFFENAEPVFSRIPMMTTVGNHETSIDPALYIDMLALPENGVLPEEVYSFDYGGCHFVSLNSCLFMNERKSQEGYEETVQAVNRWLEEDLAASDGDWTIVYMHHPMYPLAEDDEIYGQLRENWEEILTENEVDLVLCGHQHVYMRTEPIDGITYIMANSGEKQSYYLDEGAALPEYVASVYEDGSNYLRIDVDAGELKVTAYGEGGQQIDSCELRK